jgi:hypothetical protein
MSAALTFSVKVKPGPNHRLSGWYQAEVTADGLRLIRKGKSIRLPVGRAEYLSGNSLRVEHDGAWAELAVAKLGTHTDILARDLAEFLAGDRPPPAGGYSFPWYFWVLCLLPIGIPAVAVGGAIWAALGFGLASLCFTIAGRTRWPVPVRVVLMLLASGVGYAILGAAIIFLQIGPLAPKNPPAVRPPVQPRPAVPQPYFNGQRFEVEVEGVGVEHLRYTPDGRTLLVLGGEGRLVTVDTATGAPTDEWQHVRTLTGNVRSADVSPDGKRAVVGGYSRIAGPVVVDLDARTVLAQCEVTANEVRDHVLPVRDVAFADGGAKVLAVAGDKLIAWDAATGRRVREMVSPPVIASQPNSLFELCVRQNGRLVVTGGQHVGAIAPGELVPFRLDLVWSLDTGKPERELNFTAPLSLRPGVKDTVRRPAQPHTEARQLHVSADGRYALVGRPDGVLAMDLAAGKQLPDLSVEIKTHTGSVLPVAFAADGAAFAVIKPDGEIDFHRLPDLERIGSLWSSGKDWRVTLLAFAPDGEHLAVRLVEANLKGSKVVVVDLEKAVDGWTPRPAAGR